jgi:hypothetical protein
VLLAEENPEQVVMAQSGGLVSGRSVGLVSGVGDRGLEPRTSALSERRSNQLS